MLGGMVIVLIRTRLRDGADVDAYGKLSARMYEIVSAMPGFLGEKEYVAADGDRVSIMRFASAEALLAWRNEPEHVEAQRLGREVYFQTYDVTVCDVARAYQFEAA
jgi:heme-degrading monooxygenase HmoA